jgi:hypothetical protein
MLVLPCTHKACNPPGPPAGCRCPG